MGLRHRTALSILRMQRRNAEAGNSSRANAKTPMRTARHVFFSHIDPTAIKRNRSLSPAINRLDQEDSLRLLQRLRQALHPHNEEQLPSNKEYESLQDELLRLSQHIAQQKSRTSSDTGWDDTAVPYLYEADQGPDSLPYRTIKIVVNENKSIERLDVNPSDLSSYREAVAQPPVPARSLTLVPSNEPPKPEAPDLLIDEEVQLGHATANLTQQSLETRGPRSVQVSIRPEVALSLLDT